MVIIIFSIVAIISICFVYKRGTYTLNTPKTDAALIALTNNKLKQTVESLPDQAVKSFWQQKLDANNFKVIIQNRFPDAPTIKVAPENNEMEINTIAFNNDPLDHRWCILVHESQHFLYASTHPVSLVATQTPYSLAKEEYYDEHNSFQAEMIFARNHNLLEKYYPDVVRYSRHFGFDQAIHMATIDYLLHCEFYKSHWKYFLEIFNKEIVPQYQNLHPIRINS